MNHPEFAEQMREQYENRPEFPPAVEPEAALYDGFLNDTDRIKVAAVRNEEPAKLADFQPDFLCDTVEELQQVLISLQEASSCPEEQR